MLACFSATMLPNNRRVFPGWRENHRVSASRAYKFLRSALRFCCTCVWHIADTAIRYIILDMMHRLLTISSAVSLLLLTASVALWIRSCRWVDTWWYAGPDSLRTTLQLRSLDIWWDAEPTGIHSYAPAMNKHYGYYYPTKYRYHRLLLSYAGCVYIEQRDRCSMSESDWDAMGFHAGTHGVSAEPDTSVGRSTMEIRGSCIFSSQPMRRCQRPRPPHNDSLGI